MVSFQISKVNTSPAWFFPQTIDAPTREKLIAKRRGYREIKRIGREATLNEITASAIRSRSAPASRLLPLAPTIQRDIRPFWEGSATCAKHLRSGQRKTRPFRL